MAHLRDDHCYKQSPEVVTRPGDNAKGNEFEDAYVVHIGYGVQ